MKTTHQQLLEAVNGRLRKGYGGGITTADRYVSHFAECVGPHCSKNFATAQQPYSKLLKEAAETLVYSGPQWSIQEKSTSSKDMQAMLPKGIELPKHAMMLIKNTLTTPREDRDRDVLETKGARPDAKMPFLWQHLHTLPIGKAAGVAEHTDEFLKMWTVLCDFNELTSDVCKMFEAEILRFSHGFRALEFRERKSGDGEPIGFCVKLFEIMEESAVSVASNVEAEVEMYYGGKFKSDFIKAHAKAMRDRTKRAQLQGMDFSSRGVTLAAKGKAIEFGSLRDLKAAFDSGLIVVKTNDSPKDQYATQAEAEARAAEIGCSGFHQYQTEDGGTAYMPCGTHDEWLDQSGTRAGQSQEAAKPDGTELAATGQTKGSDAMKTKAATDVDLYENPVDAETRAGAMGCIGYHEVGGKFRPCGSPEAYQQQAQASINVTGTTGDTKTGDGSGGTKKPCECKEKAAQFERLQKSLSGAFSAYAEKAGIGAGRKYIDSAMLVGSFNWIYEQLQEKARKFLMMSGIDVEANEQVYVNVLYADRGIIVACEYDGSDYEERYFQAAYAMNGDSCDWTGTATEVEVSTTISIQAAGARNFEVQAKRFGLMLKACKAAPEKFKSATAALEEFDNVIAGFVDNKAGRTLSAKNLETLKEVHDDLAELAGMEMPRAGKALAERCQTKIKSLMDSAGAEESGKGSEPEPAKPAQIDVKEAAKMLLMSDDMGLLKRVHDSIGGILAGHTSEIKGKEYRKFFGKR